MSALSPFWIEVGAGLLVLAVGGVVTLIYRSIASGFHDLRKGQTSTNQQLVDIKTHLATMNGRLGKNEQWQQLHEAKDDERHEEMRTSMRDLWKAQSRQETSG